MIIKLMVYETIAQEAGQNDISVALALKQYIGEDLLAKLYENWQGVVLQGGGALSHVYGSPRLSVDLDFAHQLPAHDLKIKLTDILSKYVIEKHFECSYEFAFTNPSDDRLTRIKLVAVTPLGERNSLHGEFYSVPVHQSEKRNLRGTQHVVIVESPTELLADKIKATIERQGKRGFLKISDLFDIWYLKERTGAALDRELVGQKFIDYCLVPSDFNSARKAVQEKLARPAAIADALKRDIKLPKSFGFSEEVCYEIIRVARDIFDSIREP